jgi:hypothetical protein
MQIKYILSLLVAAMLFNACDEGNFEQIVEIDIPPHESRLAINALFLSNTDSLPILVSNSLGILDTSEFEDIKNASVRLERSGASVGAFSYDNRTGYYTTKLSEPLGNNPASYTLEVESSQYPMASAVQQMPTAPIIAQVQTEEQGTVDEDGYRVDEIIVDIEDIAGEKQYYGLRAFIKYEIETTPGDTVEFREQIYLYSSNPLTFVANRTGLGLLISDGSFDGTRYTLRTYTYSRLPFGQPGVELEVELISLTEATYQYTRSLVQYYDSVDNPFAEPVTVYSNIENGYGIFGLGSVSTRLMPLE